jgi:uncharacterized protein DUF481
MLSPHSLFRIVLISTFCLISVLGKWSLAAAEVVRGTVTFSNGDQLSGTFDSATAAAVTFTGTVAGKVTLKWTDIASISVHSGEVRISRDKCAGQATVAKPTIVVSAGALTIRSQSASEQQLSVSESFHITPIDAANPQEPEKCGYVKATGGTVKFGPESVVRATQKQVSLSGGIDIGTENSETEKLKHQTTTILTEALYTDSRKPDAGAVITQLYSGTFQNNFYLTDAKSKQPGPYLYAIANAYRNISLGVDVEHSYGGGIGWDGEHNGSSYTLAADVRYLREDLHRQVPLSLAVAGLTEQYSYTFGWAKMAGLTVFQRITLLPAFNDSRAFQVRGTAGIDFPIGKAVTFDVSYLDDYVRNAPPTSLQNFGKVVVNLKYVFSKGSPY